MANVARGEQFTASKILRGFADEDAVHDDVFTDGEILGEEFMFFGDVGEQKVILT